MRRLLALLLTLTLLTACSISQTAWGPPVSLDRPIVTGSTGGAGSGSIAVLSLIGSTFTVQKVGMTVFGNERAEENVSGWGMDDIAFESVSKGLSGKGSVKRLTLAAGGPAVAAGFGGLLRDTDAELQQQLRRASAGQSFDTYIVVVPTVSAFGTTNQSISGIGIVQASSVLSSTAWVHALFTVRVFDGRTFNQLGWKHATIGQARFMSTIKGPHREVDLSWWPAPGKAAEEARLKAVVHELLQQAIISTLPEALDLKVAQR